MKVDTWTILDHYGGIETQDMRKESLTKNYQLIKKGKSKKHTGDEESLVACIFFLNLSS